MPDGNTEVSTFLVMGVVVVGVGAVCVALIYEGKRTADAIMAHAAYLEEHGLPGEEEALRKKHGLDATQIAGSGKEREEG